MTIGGSYPGALSAWFKVLYPELVVAAYSSSGVIEPIKYFNDFDSNIFKALYQSNITRDNQTVYI